MKKLIQTLFAFLLFVITSLSVQAQVEQVAFVPGIFELDAKTIQNLNAFPADKKGLQSATLLRDGDGKYSLSLKYNAKGQNWEEQKEINLETLEIIRAELKGQLVQPVKKQSTSNGRGYLITSATLHSIPQGILFGNLFTTTESYPWGTYERKSRFGHALPLISGAGAFGVSLLATKDRYISPSSANMHFWGSNMGYFHGAYLLFGIAGDDFTDETSYFIMPAASLAEGWLLYGLAKRKQFSYERSMAWSSGNFWGTGVGSLSSLVIDPDLDSPRLLGISGLVGAGLGIYLFDYLDKVAYRSKGDYRAINTMGLIGASWGASSIGENGSTTGSSISLITSSALGLVAGYVLTSNTQFTGIEGSLISLGAFTGGLLGTGMAIIIEPETSRGFFLLLSGGATAGWFVGYGVFKNKDKSNGIGFRIDKQSEAKFNLNPASIGFIQSSPTQQAHMLRQNINPSIASMHVTF
jgi:hypothetical protein